MNENGLGHEARVREMTKRCEVFPVHGMKVYIGGVEIMLHSFLTSALYGDE
jgi:hypothetical protein